MIVEFDTSFYRYLAKIRNKSRLRKIENKILELEKSNNLSKIKNVKKLTGFKYYYRIRIGDYRIGFESIDDKTIRLIIITHRKDIYKKFP